MLQKIKRWIRRHFDYEIVGEYYEADMYGHKRKKYMKKWHFKR